MTSAEITRTRSANSSSSIDVGPGNREVSSIAPRFSLSNLSIKDLLPLLIGTLLSGIIIASTGVSYREVKESSLEHGRQRLQNLTQQPATIPQQSPPLSLTKL